MLKAVTSGPNEISEGCQFPTGPNTTCGVPIPARGRGPGAPRLYCDHPDHNAQKALRHRRKDAEREARSELAQPSLRPVTDGMVTLVGLLDRYEHLCGELAAVAADAADVLAELTDPATVEREIAEIQRHATRRITAAEQGQADAEKASAAMARRLERAVELEQLAFAAAEEATANTEQATARLAQVENEATERVAAAEADRDRVDNETEAVLTESRVHVDAARAGQARAEGERDAAQAAARAAAEENVRLRRTLDEQIAGHRRQVEARDLEYARAITAAHAIADRAAREHRVQLSELLYQHAAQPASQPGVADEVDQRG